MDEKSFILNRIKQFISKCFNRIRKTENPISIKLWHEDEMKKIVNYMATGDILHVELSKDAIEGTLKIGDEIIPVYTVGIDVKDVLPDLRDDMVVSEDGSVKLKKTCLVREFTLREKI